MDGLDVFGAFWEEALRFMRYDGPVFRLVCCEFECHRFPRRIGSSAFYHPVRIYYDRREIWVHKEWIEAAKSENLPSIIRSFAYYYAYGIYNYHQTGCNINPYPIDADARAFMLGLSLLNGVPLSCSFLQHFNIEKVLRILNMFTHKQYKLVPCIGVDGHKAFCLSLADTENKRLISFLDECDSEAHNRVLNIRYGTKENPFEDINEAIKFIEFLEHEEVESDRFLNSDFNKSPYRYDIAKAVIEGDTHYAGIYKIPWASTFTAHTENSFPSNSFVVTQLNPSTDDWEWLHCTRFKGPYIPLFGLKPNLSRRRFLFRGQCEEFVNKETQLPTCRPNLYRPGVHTNLMADRIKAYEMACLIVRHPLVKLLGIQGVKIFNESFRFQLNRLGLAQHYYNKTSLLDLTSDINVAKFFATCSPEQNGHTYMPYYSTEKLGVIYLYDLRLPYDFQTTSLPQLSSIGKQYVFLRSALQSGFLLNMPQECELHDLPNVYRIYFKHNKDISEQTARETNFGEKYFPQDALSWHWRKMDKAPNSSFTISRKAREMYLRMHPNDFPNAIELDRALRNLDFKLGGNEWPEFPKHILEDYYKNAPELWSQFCSDIYFLGAEGRFMKQSLENIINNPEYKWAFFQ